MDGAVQRTDSAIGFPNIYPLDSDLLYSVDSAIQLLNNWGLLDSVMGRDYIEISGYVVGKIHSQIKPVVSLVWFTIFFCFLALINQRSLQRKFWFKLRIDFIYSRYIIRSGAQQTLFLFRTNQSENGNFRAF